jgi:O-antigen/teichoic acid export membrane protein
MIGSLLIYSLGAALAFISQIVLANLMGATEYGIYYYAMSWYLIVALFGQFGLDQALLRFIPAYAQADDWSAAKGTLNLAGRLVTTNSLLLGALLVLVVLAIGDRIGESQRYALLIAAACVPFRGWIYIRQAVLRSFMYTIRSLLPEAIIAPSILISLALCIRLTPYAATAPVVMTLTLVALLFSFTVGAYWQYRFMPNEMRGATPRYEKRLLLQLAISMLIINGTYLMLNHIDLIILGFFRPPDEVGIYGVSSRAASMVTFPLIAAYPVFAPLIAGYQSAGHHAELQQTLTQGMRIVTICALSISLTLLFFGTPILCLFGEEFTRGRQALTILAIGQTVSALCGPVALLLAYGGREITVAIVLASTVVVDIALNLALIPRWGIAGAAFSTALSICCWSVLLFSISRRQFGLDSNGWFPVSTK